MHKTSPHRTELAVGGEAGKPAGQRQVSQGHPHFCRNSEVFKSSPFWAVRKVYLSV